MVSFLFSRFEVAFSIAKEELKKWIQSDTKVVIIPFSFAKETTSDGIKEFYEEKLKKKYIKPLEELGLKESNVSYLDCYSETTSMMIEKINQADIIILPGGNPEMFYQKIKEKKLITTLRNYKGVIIGSSAGTEIQLKDYFITAKNNYYQKFDWYKGIGILKNPFFMDVHSIKEVNYLEQFQTISKEKKKDVYAIFDDGCMIYNRENHECKVLGNVLKFHNDKKGRNNMKLKQYRDPWLAEKVEEVIGFYPREFYPLDNFSSFKVEWKGYLFTSSEEAYQAASFMGSNEEIVEQIKHSHSADEAQRIAYANRDKRRKDWDEVKDSVMEEILRLKVEQNPYVKKKLLETEDYLIVEDSPKDAYWGWGPNRDGENHLGKIWMKIRDELKEKE